MKTLLRCIICLIFILLTMVSHGIQPALQNVSAQDTPTPSPYPVITAETVKKLALIFELKEQADPQSPLGSVVFSPNSQMLASGGKEQVIRIWDVGTGSLLHTLEGHTGWIRSLTFSPDGKLLASGAEDSEIRIWDVDSGALVYNISRYKQGIVFSLMFSPDGKLLASGTQEEVIRLWDTSTWESQIKLQGNAGNVFDVEFSPDGKLLASANLGNLVQIWDVSTGEILHEIGVPGVPSEVAFSPDGLLLASAGRDDKNPLDQRLFIWDVKTGNNVSILSVGDYASFDQVWFSPDGKLVFAANQNCDIVVWDAQTLERLYTFNDECGYTKVLSPNGSLLATGSFSNVVRIWGIK